MYSSFGILTIKIVIAHTPYFLNKKALKFIRRHPEQGFRIHVGRSVYAVDPGSLPGMTRGFEQLLKIHLT
jgi:hypothetical protein